MGQFTRSEADDILAAEFDVLNERVQRIVEYPEHITAHNLLLARLYARFNGNIRRSMKLCGIPITTVIISILFAIFLYSILFHVVLQVEKMRFDSVHFHKCRNDASIRNSSPECAKMAQFYA